MRHRLAALLASALSLSAVLPAMAADYYEASRQPAPIVANALVPSCEDPRVVAQAGGLVGCQRQQLARVARGEILEGGEIDGAGHQTMPKACM